MASQGIHMRREINLVHASSIMTGIIIGSGIFVSPVSFVINCGSVAMSLIMWIFCGILTLFVALCFNELGGIFPKSGGEYTFFKEILGPLPAFLDVWQHLVAFQPSFQAILGITTTDYLVQAIFQQNCDIPQIAVKLFTIWIIVTVVVLNSLYVKYVARVQTFLTVVKIVPLVCIIVIGIIQLCKGNVENLQKGFENTKLEPGGYAIAFHSGIFTYMGWQYLFCMMEEVKKKKVPTATLR